MVPARYISIKDGQVQRMVAVSQGTRPYDLGQLLEALFPSRNHGQVVALEDDTGTVVSLSTACKDPDVLSSPSYTVLRALVAQPSEQQGLLLAAVSILLKNGAPKNEASLLTQMIMSNHSMLDKIYKRYEENGHLDLLIESLRSLARYATRRLEQISAQQQQQPAATHAAAASTTPKKQLSGEKKSALVAIAQQMANQGKINREQFILLKSLIVRNYDSIRAAYEVFEYNRDLDDLADTLMHILQIYVEKLQQANANGVNGGVGGPDANADTYPVNELYNIAGAMVQKKLIDIDDGLVLEYLIEKRHPILRAAIMVFQQDRDEKDMIDTIQRVAKHFGITRVLKRMEIVCNITPAMFAKAMGLFMKGDDRLLAAWDVFVDAGGKDDVIEEFMDSILRVLRLHVDALVAAAREGETPATNNTEDKGWVVIRQTINKIHSGGLVTDDEKEQLDGMIDTQDSYLLGVLQQFAKNQNPDELVSKLKLIANMYKQAIANAQHELRDLVDALKTDDRVDGTQRDLLVKLIDQKDPRIIRAHALYVENRGIDELVNTLLLLVNTPQQAAAPSTDDAPIKIRLWRFLIELVQGGKIRTHESAVLAALVDAEDPALMAAFDVFAETGDQDDLVDSLKRIAQVNLDNKANEDSHEGLSPEQGQDVEGWDSGEDDDDEEAEGTSNGQLLEKLKDVVSDMQLKPEDVAKLQNAVTRGDPVIDAAVELYGSNGDSEELKDTLMMVLSKTDRASDKASSSNGESGGASNARKDMDMEVLGEALEEVLAYMETEGKLGSEDATEMLRAKLQATNKFVVAALDLYVTDRDIQEAADTLERIVARR